MNIDEARRLILEAVKQASNPHERRVDLGMVIQVLQQQQRYRGLDEEQLLLTAWYDLFRTGVLSWGYNFTNSGMQFAHVTEHGERTVAQVSRDPANPIGYLALLDPVLPKGAVARSYIEEALKTYGAGCDKATAVMVGAAAEAMALDLRDILVERMNALGKVVADKLTSWMIKTVLDAVEAELKPYAKKKEDVGGMARELSDRFSGHWPSFTTQLRMARNDAGHPSSVDPVTRDMVHGNLLIFPEVARLAADLQTWVRSSYA
jgi:hypothetical protein